MKPLILSLVNNKGGDGKTTSAIQIAHILATVHNLKGLFVDLDGQANGTMHLLGTKEPPKVSIADLFTNPDLSPLEVVKGLDGYWGNLVLLPANRDLHQVDRDTVGQLQRELMLDAILDPFYKHVDFVVIDTPPSIDIRVINALIVSTHYIIPTRTSEYSLAGIKAVNQLVALLKKKNLAPDLEFLGVLCTQYDKAASHAVKALLSEIKVEVSGRYLGEVHHTVRVEEASRKKLSLQTIEEGNRAAVAYRRVAQIIAEKL